jgi:hypothetical protein
MMLWELYIEYAAKLLQRLDPFLEREDFGLWLSESAMISRCGFWTG